MRSLHENFLRPWKIPPREVPLTYYPLINPPPPPKPKIPLKPTVHFQITINICKHWSKFVTCGPSHGPQVYKVFWLRWIKLLSQKFWFGDFGKIISVDLGTLQFFWSLKKGTRTFHFLLNEPSHKTLGPLGRYDHPWDKKNTKKQINTHPWSAFWQNIQNSTFFSL